MMHRRVAGYLPRTAGYLPRVGAIGAVQNLMQNAGLDQYSAAQLGHQMAQAELAKQYALSTSVVDTGVARESLFLPITKDACTLGAQTITVVPACDYQAEEFTVGANGGNFEILGIRIGMRPLFAADGPIPALQFAPNSLASRACAGIIRAGTPIQVNVSCLVAGTDFRGAFSGAGLVSA